MTAQSLQLRDALTDALRYWEPRRIVYNLALAVVVISHAAWSWYIGDRGFTTDTVLVLFVLAVLANVAYCAAYVADLPMQFSALRSGWLRYRFLVLAIGIVFAAVITHFFSYGMFRAVI